MLIWKCLFEVRKGVVMWMCAERNEHNTLLHLLIQLKCITI